jgi:hypothetical protein
MKKVGKSARTKFDMQDMRMLTIETVRGETRHLGFEIFIPTRFTKMQ